VGGNYAVRISPHVSAFSRIFFPVNFGHVYFLMKVQGEIMRLASHENYAEIMRNVQKVCRNYVGFSIGFLKRT
jgi:hypothetical protein